MKKSEKIFSRPPGSLTRSPDESMIRRAGYLWLVEQDIHYPTSKSNTVFGEIVPEQVCDISGPFLF